MMSGPVRRAPHTSACTATQSRLDDNITGDIQPDANKEHDMEHVTYFQGYRPAETAAGVANQRLIANVHLAINN